MAGDDYVEELRAQIAEIDRLILDAVNARIQLVARLKEHKEQQGMPFLDIRQERKVLRDLQKTNKGPLSERGVRELAGELLELMKRELRQS